MGVDDVRAIAAAVPGRARELVASSPDERWRRADQGWCAAEYLCHVRDVFATFAIRLHRARTEDDPPLEPMFNDLRARRFGYRGAAPAPGVAPLDAPGRSFLARPDRVADRDPVAH